MLPANKQIKFNPKAFVPTRETQTNHIQKLIEQMSEPDLDLHKRRKRHFHTLLTCKMSHLALDFSMMRPGDLEAMTWAGYSAIHDREQTPLRETLILRKRLPELYGANNNHCALVSPYQNVQEIISDSSPGLRDGSTGLFDARTLVEDKNSEAYENEQITETQSRLLQGTEELEKNIFCNAREPIECFHVQDSGAVNPAV
ncbi:hypothetical protein IW261DRAFT_1419864 [Armillaria novae-zelandiae]|uniref:Uncharacterized protein n=1 Tax=Armillaria novae-zelandiae TaxID=153914 RepID=A0AA39UHI8_9AGAR|nr:hypothetical protein IW261DRAFT_1419864 [Armillaria novae-zelandiae]